MTDARLRVTQAGPLVTIQDAGRQRMLRYGVPASGPMDRAAFAVANALLGNLASAPALEVSLGGLTVECIEGNVTVAVAGGGFRVTIGDTLREAWSVVTLHAGSRLSIRSGPWGSWCYLAFAGTLQARSWLDSRSTHAASGLGGGKVEAGQILSIGDADTRPERERVLACPPWLAPGKRLAIVLGPQDRHFARTSLAALANEPFTLTDAFDRMGVRLSGPSLTPAAVLDMPSEALVRGSIQVAGDGVATVLLADHQTTGGYPKIATVVSSDIDRLAQMRSGDTVRLVPVPPESAVEHARSHARRLAALLQDLVRPPETLLVRLLSSNLIDGVVSGHEGE